LADDKICEKKFQSALGVFTARKTISPKRMKRAQRKIKTHHGDAEKTKVKGSPEREQRDRRAAEQNLIWFGTKCSSLFCKTLA
jgi:hypothetical protein